MLRYGIPDLRLLLKMISGFKTICLTRLGYESHRTLAARLGSS